MKHADQGEVGTKCEGHKPRVLCPGAIIDLQQHGNFAIIVIITMTIVIIGGEVWLKCDVHKVQSGF